MKLSLIFELLMIFVLLAFAASKSVRNQKKNVQAIQNRNDGDKIEEVSSINRYCKCAEAFCNCCRDFSLPLINLDGPGCASLRYINGDKMSVSLSFGKKVITNKTLSGRKPSPVCMPLPGGVSKFCGRVYNIARSGEEFRACLGLELQTKKTVEAAVRVSCFKFGPRGVLSEAPDPLPLVPQDEKVPDDNDDDDDEDDDDDDDDDDFGLGDDDDDDAELPGINDVDTADYTGFSLLDTEDLIGDLFGGTSSSKKPNKNKIKKKQAPLPSTTTTTTTKRPRPTRRPTRRPATRITTSTTPRPTRTTTVRIRPANVRRTTTQRPSKRPGSRPNRRPTTSAVTENSVSPSVFSTTSVKPTSVFSITPNGIQTTEKIPFSTSSSESFEPVVIVTQKPMTTLPVTSPKPVTVTHFEDPGLQMSLAQLTGQLSAMPATPIVPDNAKDGGMMTASREEINYEKIETITPKGTTVAFSPHNDEKLNDDLIQIVENLDSSEEKIPDKEKETMKTDESRGHAFVAHDYEGLSLTKKKKNNGFGLNDLDVIGLSEAGEAVGEELGLFGRNKRQQLNGHEHKNEDNDYDILGLGQISQTVEKELGLFGRNKRHNKNKDNKLKGNNEGDDYEMLGLDTIGDTLGFERRNKNEGNIKKDRRRQNKMMRGDWS